MERVEFAAARRGAQDQAIARLEPLVRKALLNMGDGDWWRPLLAPTRDLFNSTLKTDSGGDHARDVKAWAALSKMLAGTLPKTHHKDDTTVTAIATYLSTAAINAAAVAAARADREPIVLEWVTMHDNAVRTAHHDTDGQQRPPGEAFDVGGFPMKQPGDTNAPIELWINCRCMVRPALSSVAAAAVVAAASTGGSPTGRVVVGLPRADDPVHGIGPEDKHMTLVWLGKPEENPDLNMDDVRAHVAGVASQLDPWTSDVQSVEPLGEDGAQVWMCPPDDAGANLAHTEVNDGAVHEGYQAVQQHPQFTPHMTIGYDEPPPEAQDVSSITFDRLAVWDGEDQQEFPLGGKPMKDTAAVQAGDDFETDQPLAWHGVLCVEDSWSGDGRKFAADALRFRDLPIPLTWQEVSADGHGNSMVVAKIEQINRVGNQLRGRGHWLASEDADKAIGLVSEFGKFGVSIDADDAQFDFDEETSRMTFSSARISAACLVPIPAFAEAFVSMGPGPAGFMVGDDSSPEEDCDPNDPNYDECVAARESNNDGGEGESESYAVSTATFVSDAPWSSFSKSDYSDAQWKSACILDRGESFNTAKTRYALPIKEPSGALNRNGVHAAASRFGSVQASSEAKSAAKAALRGAYKSLGEEPPDSIAASADDLTAAIAVFKRGPGWITDPVATKRIHDYWTVPGQPGYEKIGWGAAGDFNRCKIEIGQEIAEKDPETVAKWMNNICAQWHHDATGFWPGKAPAERAASMLSEEAAYLMEGATMAPAVTLVASGGADLADSTWFLDPEFSSDGSDPRMVQDINGRWAAPLSITEDGRVWGHLAAWGTCHTGYPGVCVTAPHSATGYAHFLTGAVRTDAGLMPVGQLTVGGGHPDSMLSMRQALAHYAETGTAVADVSVGEDEFGVWMAGRVRPGIPQAKVDELLAASLSGDWREPYPGADMELVAALGVNSPGFPVPRVGVSQGAQISLVAAGAVSRFPAQAGEYDYEVLANRVADVQARRRQKMAALRAKVGAEV